MIASGMQEYTRHVREQEVLERDFNYCYRALNAKSPISLPCLWEQGVAECVVHTLFCATFFCMVIA